MTVNIAWEFFISAKSKDKCLKILHKITKSLNIESEIQECEKYWKDTALFKANLKCSLQTKDIQYAVFEVLVLSSVICRRWIVGTPQEFDNEKWEFSGWASKKEYVIPGVSEASFKLST